MCAATLTRHTHQGGDEASSILDWERRMIAIAAAKYPDGLRVRYQGGVKGAITARSGRITRPPCA